MVEVENRPGKRGTLGGKEGRGGGETDSGDGGTTAEEDYEVYTFMIMGKGL